jgi:hypothetical protein
MVHGKAPIGTRPRLAPLCLPALVADRSSPRQRGQSQAGSGAQAPGDTFILTVLKRSVVGWVKEATSR